MQHRKHLLLAALLSAGALALPTTAAQESFTPLFNGKDLDGWEQRNGDATYHVEDGVIVGKTGKGKENSFLCSKKEYGDFELTFAVKLDPALNSGVQIRSKSKGDTKDGRVHGPQVEIAANGNSGFIYGEGLGTGWLNPAPGKKDPEPHKFFKNNGWNNFRVQAVGKHIKTWVNGYEISDFMEEKSGMASGFIGLQVHAIKAGTGPFEVRFKDIKIRDLSKKSD